MKKFYLLGLLISVLVFGSICASDRYLIQETNLDLDEAITFIPILPDLSFSENITNSEDSIDKKISFKYESEKDLFYQIFETQEQYHLYQNVLKQDILKDWTEKLLKGSTSRHLLKEEVKLQPWNCHFFLEMIYPDSPKPGQITIYHGSATLIQPNLLLTAAHNLYDHKEQYNYPKEVVCFGACYGNDRLVEASVFPREKFTSVHVSQSYINSQPKTAARKSSDIALIIFDQEIAKSFSLKNLTPVNLVTDFSKITTTQLEGLIFNVTGYPGERIAHTMHGKVTKRQAPNTVQYNIDTEEGQSGSGIWFKNKNKVYCIGVHTYAGEETENFNIGTLVNSDIVKTIRLNPFLLDR